MKKFLLFLLIALTCFNLAGGYAIAATVLSKASASVERPIPHHPGQHVLRKSSLDLLLLQVSKSEIEEDDSLEVPFKALNTPTGFYRFSSDFRQLNRHFLVHYAASIKDKFPAAYLLHQNFRI